MKVSSDTGSALELHKAGVIYTCKGLEGQTLAEACWMSLKDIINEVDSFIYCEIALLKIPTPFRT
jgi:hypothetical protein